VLASPDDLGIVRDFLTETGVTMPVLLDDQGIYASYDRRSLGESSAPYPLHVVLDGDHVIRHLTIDSDPVETVRVISELLDAG
jgi:peroxiredoxin